MSEDLQRVVDALARQLGRAVAVDDVHFRLLAYSAQAGPIDDMRARVILDREAPPEAVAWLRRFRLPRADGPVRLPAAAEFDLLPRVAIPIRFQGVQFGYLWLIDAGEPVNDAGLALAGAAADEAAEVLFRERALGELHDARVGEFLRDLLSEDHAARVLAADGLVESDLFAARGEVVAVVVAPLPAASQEVGNGDRLALGAALRAAAAAAPVRESMILIRPAHGLLVVTQRAMERIPRLADDLCESAARRLGRASRWRAVVAGVGRPVARLADTATSYRQALDAIRVADVIPRFRPVARHDALGIYSLLAAQPREQLRGMGAEQAIAALVGADPELLLTAETFLDRAGDTRAVAERLGVHRATVYYRLRRIEELTGFNLSDGERRLVLHLGIKAARLLGDG
ncbi:MULTISPECIES: PucR family transcriptional regulator [Amycolatopsis]|uniref:Helix-turn-helix domain-containing protein n=1 Tax=Amycolatopsis dendrobii TaxID=2760662 RepID=A0A7W3Z948_9PSEU|nr:MULTISPECIES: helix-turn-helix domain-containing protein [Amycolatopsis]MBB1152218.1 helix-turn-helix domain-containing protein [Amycolatopsis dendrobii]UKD57508.1 helix-turn-helix domain-containing protein [Amycolatopsis sp. FU40]